MKTSMRTTMPRAALAKGLILAVLSSSCTMHDVTIPEFDGPSTTGIGMSLTASPDLLVADGSSRSLITATVFGPDGRAVAGRDVFFTIADANGQFADIGQFPTSNGPGTGVSVTTNGNGVAQVTYEAPVRTDATANQKIQIAARLMGTDAQGATYHTVAIELRSAQPKLFPPNPNNVPPHCAFTMEAPGGRRTNQTILFQDTSFDSDGVIVRYQWDFGDGTGVNYDPDIVHVYRSPGTYTLTHIVTDNNGGDGICTAPLTITN